LFGITFSIETGIFEIYTDLIVFQVSWVRRRDWHILTSGVFTYTNDERFQVAHTEGSDDWTLQIKYVQKRDNGTYECQVRPYIFMFDF
jgi:hypothetical protein